jgi:D-alanyl-D-alanine carboxypeptidase (penicillin-binding protein 5/6)
VVLAVAGALVVTGATVSALRVTATPPAPAVRVEAPLSIMPLPGPPKPVLQPPQGSIAVQGNGADIALLDADRARPIASVAKAMTALVVLRAHPLADALDEGPVLTMTAVDVQDWKDTVARDGSSLPVSLGQRLTERQLLLGVLLPSANNFADTLGRWTSGSLDAFVALLNQAAQQMGMARTHFADPSGYSPETVSSAADLVLLGRAVLEIPALAALVATQEAHLPDGTLLQNLDALLGTVPGWLGIKTGSTPQAGGCLLFAARRDLGNGATVTLVGAVLAQTDLHAALDAARSAVETGFEGYGVIQANQPLDVRGSVTARWGAQSLVRAEPIAGKAFVVRVGTPVHLVTRVVGVQPDAVAGTRVATVEGSVDGAATKLQWAVVLDNDIPGPSVWWRFLHGGG